ncbi:PH and SEC7 domain-containing protein isoform X2 [Planococcus citri]|uniref:PH and SEC7 domain-containing protein isoform X2 n=1 Tax=Planococcus citri TaxID=170843 RepID=UPI0031F92393
MSEELIVVLNRRDDPTAGLGFSLLDKPGFPPVIYDIEENSPAAECGKVEAGDVIMMVNEIDVLKYSIKEVLKCLRLAGNSVMLKLKRDPVLKEKILTYLSSTTNNVENDPIIGAMGEASLANGNGVLCNRPPSRGRKKDVSQSYSAPLTDITGSHRYENEPVSVSSSASQPMFEAYVMTGERVLKLTKNTSLVPKSQKKIDSLKSHTRKNNVLGQNNHKVKSTPSSPVESSYNSSDTKSSSANTSPASLSSLQSDSKGVSTISKSDDDIHYSKEPSVSTNSVQVDDDELTSSLRTLLDTGSDGATGTGSKTEDKRALWTRSTPKHTAEASSSTIGSSENGSSQHSISPPSPTSVSSSVMSSMSSSTDRKRHPVINSNNNSIDLSQLEALSNISSPDYQEETSDMLNSHDIGMEVTDPSDSDSTLLVSEPKIRKLNKCVGNDGPDPVGGMCSKYLTNEKNHRVVVQVKGAPERERTHNFYNMNYVVSENNNNTFNNVSKLRHYNSLKEEDDEDENNLDPKRVGYEALAECDDELLALTEGAFNLAKSVSPSHSGSSEEESGSDVESLHSFHYSPKAVDYPSAQRLAKRLYNLEGFRKSDVSRHLSKDNEFNRTVAEEYLKYFDFTDDTLEQALRKFLRQFSLTGETQERERVLVHFSRRYLDCNPGSFNSQDAIHTLTCAIMLLNTDLHGPNIGRKMTCNAFIENLSGLNDGKNFPRETLKSLYQAIKAQPLEWAVDDDIEDNTANMNNMPTHSRAEFDEPNDYLLRQDTAAATLIRKNAELTVDPEAPITDYKRGYVLRKCCVEPNGKRTPLGKRGWRLLFCSLREFALYLYKDDQLYNKDPQSGVVRRIIRLHHGLATKAVDYTKKEFVFRVQTADRAEYLFRASNNKELQSWIDTINLVCASFSAPALPEAVGSQKKFQRPLLPSTPSTLNIREQLVQHEQTLERLEREYESHRKQAPEKSAKNLVIQNHKEKEAYLLHEIKRYRTYVSLLRSRIAPQTVQPVASCSNANNYDDDEDLMDDIPKEDDEDQPSSSNRKRSKKK